MERSISQWYIAMTWTGLLKDCDAIESWEIFKSKMQEGMDKFIPKFNRKQSAGYVTNKPL